MMGRHWSKWAVILSGFSLRRPRVVLAATLLSSLAAALTVGLYLELRTSNLDLVDADLPPVARFLEVGAEFGTPNLLVVAFEVDGRKPTTSFGDWMGDPLRAAVDRLGSKLRHLDGIARVLDRLPFDPDALAIAGIDPYLCSHDGDSCYLFVQPDDARSQVSTLEPFVADVRRALTETLAELSESGDRSLSGGLTGMPAYAVDDKEVIARDITRLSALAAALILLVFAFAFGSSWRPLLAVTALLPAVLWTLAFAAWIPGYLTLLSSFFASLLIGLGVDGGIHLIDRLEETMDEGQDEAAAFLSAMTALAPSLSTSASTSAAVLFALRFSGFRGFAELGTIAGVGVLLALVCMASVLPALLQVTAKARSSRGRVARRNDIATRRRRRLWLGRSLAKAGRPATACLLLGLALAGSICGRPDFDIDYLALQPAGSTAVRLERQMVAESDFSPEMAVFVVSSRAAVNDLVWRLADSESVAAVRSIRDLELYGNPVDSLDGEAWRSLFVSPAGRFAVYAFPAEDIWRPEAQETLLAELRAIDPTVTGMPVLGQFLVERSRQALWKAGELGSVLLLVLLLAHFRHFAAALVAALPAFLSLGSMAGLMDLLDLSFNPLNIMALPLILGIAVDDGVHLVQRYRHDPDRARTLGGAGRSVILTSLTTTVAFGALALTDHRGLASFAITLTLGVLCALVLTLGLLPAILPWALPKKSQLPSG